MWVPVPETYVSVIQRFRYVIRPSTAHINGSVTASSLLEFVRDGRPAAGKMSSATSLSMVCLPCRSIDRHDTDIRGRTSLSSSLLPGSIMSGSCYSNGVRFILLKASIPYTEIKASDEQLWTRDLLYCLSRSLRQTYKTVSP